MNFYKNKTQKQLEAEARAYAFKSNDGASHALFQNLTRMQPGTSRLGFMPPTQRQPQVRPWSFNSNEFASRGRSISPNREYEETSRVRFSPPRQQGPDTRIWAVDSDRDQGRSLSFRVLSSPPSQPAAISPWRPAYFQDKIFQLPSGSGLHSQTHLRSEPDVLPTRAPINALSLPPKKKNISRAMRKRRQKIRMEMEANAKEYHMTEPSVYTIPFQSPSSSTVHSFNQKSKFEVVGGNMDQMVSTQSITRRLTQEPYQNVPGFREDSYHETRGYKDGSYDEDRRGSRDYFQDIGSLREPSPQTAPQPFIKPTLNFQPADQIRGIETAVAQDLERFREDSAYRQVTQTGLGRRRRELAVTQVVDKPGFSTKSASKWRKKNTPKASLVGDPNPWHLEVIIGFVGDLYHKFTTDELLEFIDAAADFISSIPSNGTSQPPQFMRTKLRRGSIAVTSANMESKRWLLSHLPRINPWPNTRLTASDRFGRAKSRRKVTLWIPGKKLKISKQQLFKSIEEQNPGINTILWKIWGQKELPTGLRMDVGMNRKSIETITERGCKLYYGLAQIEVTIDASEMGGGSFQNK